MDETLMDALLIVLKARRDPEWANWNPALVAGAEATLTARTSAAIMRRGERIARAQPGVAPPDKSEWIHRPPSRRLKMHAGQCPDCGRNFAQLERHTNCRGRG
jgi:hypothetical protein